MGLRSGFSLSKDAIVPSVAEAAPGTQRCSVYVGDKRAMFKSLQFPLTRQRGKIKGNNKTREQSSKGKKPPLNIKKIPHSRR